MTLLTKTGSEVALYFTIAGISFGFATNAHLGLTFTDKASPEVVATWTAYRGAAIAVTILFLLLGIYKSFAAHAKIEQIKANTKFDNDPDPYKPRRWPRVVLLIGYGLGFTLAGYALRFFGWF
jgi:TRAP-type C4-dicarboxylate transport system permease small subunit